MDLIGTSVIYYSFKVNKCSCMEWSRQKSIYKLQTGVYICTYCVNLVTECDAVWELGGYSCHKRCMPSTHHRIRRHPTQMFTHRCVMFNNLCFSSDCKIPLSTGACCVHANNNTNNNNNKRAVRMQMNPTFCLAGVDTSSVSEMKMRIVGRVRDTEHGAFKVLQNHYCMTWRRLKGREDSTWLLDHIRHVIFIHKTESLCRCRCLAHTRKGPPKR